MFIVARVPENTEKGATWLTIGWSNVTATVTFALADPAVFVTVTVKLSVVLAATTGVVKVALLPIGVSATCGTSVAAWVQVKVSGAVPLAVALSVTTTPVPEITELGVAVATTAVGGLTSPAQAAVFGAMLLGQGLSGPGARTGAVGGMSMPDELYPPQARKGMALKLFSTIGEPGMFSGKMYSRIGAWYCP
jgi:hypothetical protein